MIQFFSVNFQRSFDDLHHVNVQSCSTAQSLQLAKADVVICDVMLYVIFTAVLVLLVTCATQSCPDAVYHESMQLS